MSICGRPRDILLANRWKLLEYIDGGMFGCVALAKDLYLRKNVAVKFGKISDKETEYQEKAAKFGISPAIIAEGKDYFVMDYVSGKPLLYVEITKKIKDDLGCLAHILDETKILHNDLCYKNIRLDETGKPIVLDFGIAEPLKEGQSNKKQLYRFNAEADLDISKCHERYKPQQTTRITYL